MSSYFPRPSQQAVLAYAHGKLGVKAVPGSGKTHTLAELAAKLVAESLSVKQEVLVVTLVNSAVDNLRGRIDEAIRRRHLLPGFGYRVRTLHALSHDIVRERPGLVGLSEDFGIIDEQAAESVRQDATNAWLAAHPDAAAAHLQPDMDAGRANWIRKNRWPQIVQELVAAFIKRAKDLQLTPEQLRTSLPLLTGQSSGGPSQAMLDLVAMATAIYADYQHSLTYRGVVDFDDLVRLALDAMRRDADYLVRLQQRWPFILEDEAQDSSLLQEEILKLLTAQSGNWVRVGDPNQAIYDTFTTADPRLLLRFLDGLDVDQILTLPVSGRSQLGIIRLANLLVDWVRAAHPTADLRNALVAAHISPTEPGDPQPNPPLDYTAVRLVIEPMSPAGELHFVASELRRWLSTQLDRPAGERDTLAVLAPSNQRGAELADLLKQQSIPYVELLRSTAATRETAGALGLLLRCLADPASPAKLASAFRVWRRDDRRRAEAAAQVHALARMIAQCQHVEAYLWPRAGDDWLNEQASSLSTEGTALLESFREVACSWHRAAALPIDQLILTLAGQVFGEPAELALAHKLSLLLQDTAQAHPDFRLPQLVQDLEVIARNERRFLGFSSDDGAFVPPKGKVTVTTMHKAKGLEWDSVYLLSVNNYDFPSGQSHDSYRDEPSYLREQLNLQEETIGLLEALAAAVHGAPMSLPAEGAATRSARTRYVAERLRLLYVGITRAKKALTITSNTGQRLASALQPAAPLLALDLLWSTELEARSRDE